MQVQSPGGYEALCPLCGRAFAGSTIPCRRRTVVLSFIALDKMLQSRAVPTEENSAMERWTVSLFNHGHTGLSILSTTSPNHGSSRRSPKSSNLAQACRSFHAVLDSKQMSVSPPRLPRERTGSPAAQWPPPRHKRWACQTHAVSPSRTLLIHAILHISCCNPFRH